MPNKYLRYAIAILLVFGLILVRKFEDVLFYDPFLQYFHRIGHSKFPEIDLAKLNASLMVRYLINTLLTVLIVWFIFWKKSYVKFSIIIMIIGLIILLPIYNYLISTQFSSGEMVFFYVRRFLIQPMFLLILVPCFYYQEMQHKKTVEN
ncbi:exosortase F system-associated membrane protein [Empedobacter sp. UBA7248]|uniref:exosortase F system-associated membrane protein n=1 Tax=Empedobacter sp. UBA7248 TaxID=1946448 RepID=UPI0025C1C5C2|nr:exosortase F system-associated protein [Empedobacter sp. UBA7248]